MATFMTPQFPVFGTNTRVVEDPVMGRCLETTVDRRVGEILYAEEALLFSSYLDDEVKTDKELLLLKAYGKNAFRELGDIYEELSCLPKIECLDTARNLIQLIAIAHLRDSLLANKNAKKSLMGSVPIDELPDKISLLEQLKSGNDENLAACVVDIETFQNAYPDFLPKGISAARAGALLGLLNTNQVELEDFGGSGLFVGTAIMEHSCDYNCSYTTKGSRLYMAATKDVPAGSRLSIDYGNFFYSPTEQRQEELLKSYGFVCTCALCSGVDRKKAYSCPACAARGQVGVVCALPAASGGGGGGGGGKNKSNNSKQQQQFHPCLVCEQVPPASHVAACLEREIRLLEDPPETFEAAVAVGREGLLHESHHLLFAIADIVGKDLAEEAKRRSLFMHNNNQHQQQRMEDVFGPALQVMTHCCRLLDQTLPLVSPEKVIYYDRLGQLAVCAGHIDTAKQAFGSAYQMSCCACGKDAPGSRQLLELAERTPTTRTELMSHYGGAVMMEDDDDDDDDDMET